MVHIIFSSEKNSEKKTNQAHVLHYVEFLLRLELPFDFDSVNLRALQLFFKTILAQKKSERIEWEQGNE